MDDGGAPVAADALTTAQAVRAVVEGLSQRDSYDIAREILRGAVKGAGAWRQLRFESGGHRVQRVPVTETQGRIHTSAATVATGWRSASAGW